MNTVIHTPFHYTHELFNSMSLKPNVSVNPIARGDIGEDTEPIRPEAVPNDQSSIRQI